jgi:hypothetical protein
MLGRASYQHKTDGVIEPTFAFIFKSGPYAFTMNEKMVAFQEENYPNIGPFPKTLSSVWELNGDKTAFINFVAAPKCIMIDGMIF